LGLCVGSGVVVAGSIMHGFGGSLLLLGMVLAIAFGSLALIGLFVGRRTSVE
jgi:hypothetical protein